MFDKNFFPSPQHVIELMLQGEIINGKVFLEPSAGKGDIVTYLQQHGAKNVIACEDNYDLRCILATKCQLVATDFLSLESHAISHIDTIAMNPPFDNADRHILHAYNIAPPGCKIIALCNTATLENPYSKTRKELNTIIDTYGSAENLGACFDDAERQTNVNISLVKILKAGASYNTEFEGFFMDDEPEEQANGIMSYNVVRDLVNRYVGAIKIFDEQLETAVRLNDLMRGYFNVGKTDLAISVSRNTVPLQRSEYKKQLQKEGWLYIFDKLNMQKYATKGLKEEINKFVEHQTQIPFTMKNIYFMVDMVIQTHRERMDKALIEVFDKLTKHYDENRFNIEGWKTNSHYLVNQKFILPWMCAHSTGDTVSTSYNGDYEMMNDFIKALCYLTGEDYDNFNNLDTSINYPVTIRNKDTGELVKNKYHSVRPQCYRDWTEANRDLYNYKDINVEIINAERPKYGEWFEWTFFKVKAFKKGTMHFEFKDINVWAKFNQNIARIKGFPLFEHKQTTAWQDRQQAKQAKKYSSTLF